MIRALIFLLISTSVSAQVDFGVHIGISATVGTHLDNLGFYVRSNLNYKFIQLNQSADFQVSAFSYAGRRNLLEVRNAFGMVLLAGKRDHTPSFQYDALNHNTRYHYGLGYNYVFYNDNRGTSQNSGGFALHLGKLSIYHENDVFAGQAKDRFRTGNARVSWTDSLYQLAVGVDLWTGETANTLWQKICTPKMPNGFRSLEDKDYGGTSHGIAYAEIRMNEPFALHPYLRLGMDSEEIRHAIQNRFFHDLIFLPKNIERSTPHYPRVDEHGCAVFEAKQRKKDRLYLQLGLNDYIMH